MGCFLYTVSMRVLDENEATSCPREVDPKSQFYSTECEMRYGPRHVDEKGLSRIQTAVAERGDLQAPPVPMK